MEHISLDKIISYSVNQLKNKENTAIEGHLAICERCHAIFMGLKSVEKPLRQSFVQEKATSSCPEDWEIGALIQKELPSEISERITTHLKDCGFCIDRAAVYHKSLKLGVAPFETPESWKLKAIHALKAEKTVKEPKVSLIQRILDFLPDLTFPVPAAAGFAAALLAIAVLVWTFMPGKARFITIASSEKLIIRDSEIPLAFGFNGTDEIKEVEIMDISLKGKDIVFKWEPLEGAVEYEFSLKEGNKIIHDIITINQPTASLSKDLIKKERLYSWLIAGKTREGRYFEHTGDFVLAK